VQRALLLLVLLAPGAAAQVSFELAYDDRAGDVAAPSVDVLRFRARVVNGTMLEERVEMAARPTAPEDTIILRNWFRDSENGSFHVIDLEVHGQAGFAGERFRAIARRGDFENVTEVEATYGVDGDAWVFQFDVSLLADATCFDPLVWAQHYAGEGAPVVDQAFLAERACRTRGDPPLPVPRSIQGSIPQATPSPTLEAPGSRSPAPGPGLVALLLAAGATTLILRSRGLRRP
jgi:hypothetical protein